MKTVVNTRGRVVLGEVIYDARLVIEVVADTTARVFQTRDELRVTLFDPAAPRTPVDLKNLAWSLGVTTRALREQVMRQLCPLRDQ